MEHFFLNPLESKRIIGKIDFNRYPSRSRYYATVGESIQGLFCTLIHDSPGKAIHAGRKLSNEILGG